jgi:spore germination cell wall hydrolase CwlJ-like protein
MKSNFKLILGCFFAATLMHLLLTADNEPQGSQTSTGFIVDLDRSQDKPKPKAKKQIVAKDQIRCLAANIFFEARGESVEAQQAVAQVTLNRVKSKHYPDNICKVVFQHKQFSWVHQQSAETIQKLLNADLSDYNRLDTLAYQQAYKIASNAVLKPFRGIPSDVLWYTRYDVYPKWAQQKQVVGYYGSHVFYTKQKLE